MLAAAAVLQMVLVTVAVAMAVLVVVAQLAQMEEVLAVAETSVTLLLEMMVEMESL